MMSLRIDRYALRAALLLVLTVAGCAQPPPEFASTADKFQVQFGGEPKVSERAVGGRRAVVYSVEAADGVRSVAVTDILKGDEPPGMTSAYLNAARDDMVRAAGGELTADATVALAGKHPGRAFAARVAKPGPGVLRARIFLVGTRLYQVMAMGTAEYADADAATAFLESFRLTE